MRLWSNKGTLSVEGLTQIAKSSFSILAKGLQKLLTNPWLIMLTLVVSAVARFKELDKADEDFRRTTGLTADQTRDIEKAARDTSREFAGMGIGIQEAFKAKEKLLRMNLKYLN